MKSIKVETTEIFDNMDDLLDYFNSNMSSIITDKTSKIVIQPMYGGSIELVYTTHEVQDDNIRM